ncbi:MAG TPA: tryptophan 2,3-dioxygenase [Bdellovibrionales bacterium]|nr:tryptophan 2,3-dioxygenase [Thioclava sp.]HAG91614.1 tryptophan 2,3-dioxygenase [Bdellovibrionales bacterium]|tara:strand:- start:1497 stop:2576 length:1080 start_codon:yes stop_codon:yes gene_type:complete
MNYPDYLKIPELLNLQKLESEKHGSTAHDEHLFIIVHQVYELWFKQILWEVNSILDLFSKEKLDEKWMDLILHRLNRVTEIQKLMVDQVGIMETMTPLDFLDFRNLLIPASGFQSHQFRLLEIKLGLQRQDRHRFSEKDFDEQLKDDEKSKVRSSEKDLSLFELVEKWLERTPFLTMKGFDFWSSFKSSVEENLQKDIQLINENPELNDTQRAKNTAMLTESLKGFQSLFDEAKYKQDQKEGTWRLSYRALHAALLIQLYRDQPVLQLPFRLLMALQDMDELFTTWRYRHAIMAKRMLGSRVGTGGSSGFKYLHEAAEKHKVFKDFVQLTTYFIPKSQIPKLPADVEKELDFYYNRAQS